MVFNIHFGFFVLIDLGNKFVGHGFLLLNTTDFHLTGKHELYCGWIENVDLGIELIIFNS